MLTKEKSHMIVIEGSSGEDLQQRYNAAMDELTRIEITIEEKIIDIAKMSAIILYKEKVRLPQCLKDEYALMNVYPTCCECQHYEPEGGGFGRCFRLRGDQPLRDSDDFCPMRWAELEKELRERRIVNAADTQGRAQEAEGHTDLAG